MIGVPQDAGLPRNARVAELCEAADSTLHALTRCVENADLHGAIYHARNLMGIAEEIVDGLKARPKKAAPRTSGTVVDGPAGTASP